MIPGRSVLCGIKLVGELLDWCNGPLSDTVDSIQFCTVELTDVMPVNCRPIESHVIPNGDLQLVTPACLDWTRRVALALPHTEMMTDGDHLENAKK